MGLALMLTGCGSEKVAPHEVPGLYRMNRGDDVLVVCGDFAWLHRYRAPGGAPVETSGSWELWETTYGDTHALLRGYPRQWQAELSSRDPRRAAAGDASGYTAMLIERDGAGRVRLVVDAQENWIYMKDTSTAATSEAAAACTGAARDR